MELEEDRMQRGVEEIAIVGVGNVSGEDEEVSVWHSTCGVEVLKFLTRSI